MRQFAWPGKRPVRLLLPGRSWLLVGLALLATNQLVGQSRARFLLLFLGMTALWTGVLLFIAAVPAARAGVRGAARWFARVRFPFVNANPAPVFEISARGEVLYANPAAGELLRRLKMSSPAELFPEEHGPAVGQCLSSRRPLERQLEVGSRSYKVVYAPFRRGSVLVTLADVTQYKTGWELVCSLPDTNPHPVLIVDLEQPAIRYGNPSAAALCTEIGAMETDRLLSAITSGIEQSQEFELRSAEGLRHLLLFGRTLPDRPTLAFVTILDVTCLRNADRRRAALMNGLVHDVKNKLTMGFILPHLWRKGALKDEQALESCIEILEDGVKEAASLLSEALKDTEVHSYSPEEADLLTLLHKSLEPLLPLCRRENLQVFLNGEAWPDGPFRTAVPVYVDPPKMRRLLDNLLSNAVKHASSRVDLWFDGNENSLRLVIQDDGPGIPRAVGDKVFSPRDPSSGEPPISRRLGQYSSGIGLSVARGIAELHGGGLRLEPSESGARFSLSLPKETRGTGRSPGGRNQASRP